MARIPDKIKTTVIENQMIFCKACDVFFGLPIREEPIFEPLPSLSGKLIKIASIRKVLKMFRLIFIIDILNK